MTKWIEIEKGRGPHSKATLRKVAHALGESPRHIYTMASIDYDEAEVSNVEPDRLARLESQVAELLAEVRSLRLPLEAPPESPGT